MLRDMVLSRAPNLMTEKLRKIINRDTIITISIIGPIAAFLDIVTEPTLSSTDKMISYGLIVLFISVGITRLIRGSILDRRPIFAIVLYQLILMPAIAYFSDVRSFYIFFWIIPIYLASFYYGKKVVYFSFAALAITQIAKIALFTYYGYITRTEDYLYLIAEFFIVVAMSLLVIDTTHVTEEDRETLYASLEATELEQQRLSAVINSINDGVVSVDRNFLVVSYNAAALAVLDRHDTIKGKDFRQICVVEGLDGTQLAVENLIKTGRTETECRIPYADGQTATLAISAVPIRAHTNGEDDGTVFLIRDITKQKTLEEERSAYVSLISHELRTPLAIAEANASNAALIFKKGDVDKAAEAIQKVHEEITHLTAIINDFALIVSTTSTDNNITKEVVHIESVCKKLTEDYAPLASKKGIVFTATIAPNTVEALFTNHEYFINIIKSFADNAIKFTTKGSVTVHFSEENDSFLAIVEDTGAGIAKSDQSKVFSPFYQSADYETRSYGGLGVGLYTSKKLAEILGGEVYFTSEKDRGSIFSMRIPLAALTVPEVSPVVSQ